MHQLKKSVTGSIWLVGNGPSLNTQDLSKLKKRFTFCSNQYFLNPGIQWSPTFYAIEDRKGFRHHKQLMVSKVPASTVSFFEVGREGIKPNSHCFRIVRNPNRLRFSDDPVKQIFSGFSVTYMQMQIAAYLGFSEINLIGCDHSHGHFCDEDKYHQGKRHNRLRLDLTRRFIQFGVDWLLKRGVTVMDFTPNGQLQVVPKGDYNTIN